MDESLKTLAETQHGVISRAQARDGKLTRGAIAHRVRRGDWIPIGDRAFRMGGAPETARMTVMATVLNAGSDAIATGNAALALRGVRGFELLPACVVASRRPPPGAMVGTLESFRVLAHHWTIVDGIPAATPARAVFDLSRTHTRSHVERAMDAVLAGGHADYAHLVGVLADLAERGRTGSRPFRELIEARSDAYVAPESELESRFLKLLRDHGLPEPERQVSVGNELTWIGRVDFLWRSANLIVETDGATFHHSVSDRRRDDNRDRALGHAGWTVLRFTWIDVVERPTSVVSILRGALAQAA